MGKRNAVVVSSSEDDDWSRSRTTNCVSSNSKSRRRTSSASITSSNASKRSRRISNSHSHSHSRKLEQDSFDTLNEDFYDGFQEFKVTGSRQIDKRDLWVDKYKPQSLEDLAVHKKKVAEVKTWLKERLLPSKDILHNHALVITGRAGVGKSTTIHVTASHLGARLCEWNTPTPTLWQEHTHNSSSGTHYTSKLDEFETFVERIRKYPLLPLSSTGGSTKPSILLIDDLPLTNGKIALGRLHNCLHILVRSTQIPTVILITEYSKADSSGNASRYWDDLQLSLENAGACKMVFNPITLNSIKKTLSKICREEQGNVTAEQIHQIAEVSGGDIRHAITSLQYFCLTPGQLLSSSTIHLKDKADELKTSDDKSALSFGRDETLSLFHALGKFLHNKRETVDSAGFGGNLFILSERFARLPLKMDAPEKILCQANGQARPIADFLHENVLDFLSDDAMADAFAVSSYLCDVDNLLATSFYGPTWSRISNNELDSIPQLAAASVAVRGVLFGNSHPISSRWHAIRSPKLWQVEQSMRQNKNELVQQRNEACNGLISCDMFVMATEYKPVLKFLGRGMLEALQIYQEKMQGSQMDDEAFDYTGLDESDGEEIEDW